MNIQLARRVIQEVLLAGCQEFVVCAGARNTPLINVLINEASLKKWWGFEERSSAFFALGRARSTGRPVAVVTTSGTAVGELLPAVMEAYYTQVPLILLTADRPRRFRGYNAPQSCEQKNIFGLYTPDSFDFADDDLCDLSDWGGATPLHLNVCFEEPARAKVESPPLSYAHFREKSFKTPPVDLNSFLSSAERLLTIVSTLPPSAREPVKAFLKALGGDVYAEGVSGLREDFDNVVPVRENYTHVLRIGGVPTHRVWRDIEERRGVEVISVTQEPFAGLSGGSYILSDLKSFVSPTRSFPEVSPSVPAVPGLFYDLSCRLPEGSLIYLGNSLPIRHWDEQATLEKRGYEVLASRGLNGIDGQISTFLGLARGDRPNFALLGDLTTLYDLTGPWFLPQLEPEEVTLIVINNRGGRIFEPLFPMPEMINAHDLSFEPVAKLWGLAYEKWETIPDKIERGGRRLVEIAC